MAYDEQFDTRITVTIADWRTTRRSMFAGACHRMNQNILCGVYESFLILRLGENAAKWALQRPGTRPFDITGRPMKGWVMVDSGVLAQADCLKRLNRAAEFVMTLPSR